MSTENERVKSFTANDHASADSIYQYGNSLAHAGMFADAAQCYHQVIAIAPSHWLAWNNLGVMQFELGQIDNSISSYRKALSLQPTYSDCHYNLANAYRSCRNFEAAVYHYRSAISLRPNFDSAHANLGISLMESGNLASAIEHFHTSIKLRPDFAEALTGLGLAYSHLGDYDAALSQLEQAIRLEPQSAEARYNRGLVRLLQSQFVAGWADYEWRWKLPGVMRRHGQYPLWQGENLRAKTILLYTEQGLGDTIQFIRFASVIRNNFHARVIVEGPSNCVRLLESCDGVDRYYSVGQSIKEEPDAQCPLMSVAQYCVRSTADIPNQTPYLNPPTTELPECVTHLTTLKGKRIGFAWQGSPGYRWDHWRSFPCIWMEQLATEFPDFHWVSLQKGYGTEQLKVTHGKPIDAGTYIDNGSDAFIETVQIVRNLDLVITVDSALAHLAGALSIPVWVLLPKGPDWRWHITSNNSPWYPTMRLFRQERFGDWGTVFSNVATELRLLQSA